MELTNDDLEYIIFVAKEFCYPNKQLLKDNDTIRDAETIAIDNATILFKNRYPELNNEFKEEYNKYISNNEIKEVIDIYNLNIDKFWLLFLFITDFSNSCFAYTERHDTNTIRETVKDMDQLIDINKINDCTLTISCNEKSISSTNPFLIEMFKQFCSQLNKSNSDIIDTKHLKIIEVNEETVKTKKMKFFVTLFKYFLFAYVKTNKPSRMSFIGKLLYLAKIENDKEFYYTGYALTPIKSKNRVTEFKIKQYGTIFIGNKEYIKEPINVGKDIADTLKKCNNYTPINTSNYICTSL